MIRFSDLPPDVFGRLFLTKKSKYDIIILKNEKIFKISVTFSSALLLLK